MRPRNQNIFFSSLPHPAGLPNTARRQVSDLSSWRRPVSLGVEPHGRTGRNGLRACLPDQLDGAVWTRDSGGCYIHYSSHVFLHLKRHFNKWYEIQRKKKKNPRKSRFKDKNNILTENWAVCGDYESIYALQMFLAALRNGLLRLPALQRRGLRNDSNHGHRHECDMCCPVT